jgi:hypothetical protein
MTIKASKKDVQNSFICYSVDYAKLQSLFYFKTPLAHTKGAYGWYADIYVFEPREIGYKPIAIVSGYKPFGAKITEEIVDKYEKRARKALYGSDRVSKKVTKLNKLINAFLKEVQK